MRYYEVLVASKDYRGEGLTYASEDDFAPLSVVAVPLRAKTVTGFIKAPVKKPEFAAKQIKNRLSEQSLPIHSVKLARWMASYYACSLGEALRQFAPARPFSKLESDLLESSPAGSVKLDLRAPLTKDQKKAITRIKASKHTTTLLHGDTATGKTRVYLELARDTLASGLSAIILTPEISLTAQLELAVRELGYPAHMSHSQLSASERKKTWLKILESKEPCLVIGARSALFCPLQKVGLIVIDEAHEPAYKQDQSPRYHTAHVASQLGKLTGAKTVLGTATPSISDYYLAHTHGSIVTMKEPAIGPKNLRRKVQIIDLKDRSNFSRSSYLSNQLIDEISTTLSAKKQIMVYLNRRGSARLILCKKCGWQLFCPHCDLPLIYHGDEHTTRCHTCGYWQAPPSDCATCQNPDIIYIGVGTKALHDELTRLFPQAKVQRFDSDSTHGKRLNEQYAQLHSGGIDIIVGTQLLAKGLDLPKLGLVGVIAADSSLALPDFSSEERSFQLLYQVIGRVGRGHSDGRAVIQTYYPDSPVIEAAVSKNYGRFYEHSLAERKQFKFPPFAHLLKLSCKRATLAGAEGAAKRLKRQIRDLKLPVEVIGPSPSFYGRRGRYHYWQLAVKSKSRDHQVKIAKSVPADWMVDLDPIDLL